MSEKVLTLDDMRKLCGKTKKSTFDIIEYLSYQKKPVTVKEIIEGINYGENSHYINELLNDLTDLELVDKIEVSKRRYEYKLSNKKFVLVF